MARGGGNAIASAAVTLTANADGLVTGLDQAQAKIQQFGQNATLSIKKFDIGGSSGKLGGLSDKLGAIRGRVRRR